MIYSSKSSCGMGGVGAVPVGSGTKGTASMQRLEYSVGQARDSSHHHHPQAHKPASQAKGVPQGEPLRP